MLFWPWRAWALSAEPAQCQPRYSHQAGPPEGADWIDPSSLTEIGVPLRFLEGNPFKDGFKGKPTGKQLFFVSPPYFNTPARLNS